MVYFGLKYLRVRPRFAGRQHQTKNTKIVRIFKILSQNYTQNPYRPEFAVTKMNNCITFETVLVSKMITCPSKALANTCKFRTQSVSNNSYILPFFHFHLPRISCPWLRKLCSARIPRRYATLRREPDNHTVRQQGRGGCALSHCRCRHRGFHQACHGGILHFQQTPCACGYPPLFLA